MIKFDGAAPDIEFSLVLLDERIPYRLLSGRQRGEIAESASPFPFEEVKLLGVMDAAGFLSQSLAQRLPRPFDGCLGQSQLVLVVPDHAP